MITVKGKYTVAYVMIDSIDEETLKQINTIVNHPAFTNPIYIMPDTHAGKGAVIGFTMEMGQCIIPNIVGVDINCGMLTFEIENLWPFKHDPTPHYLNIDREIRKKIPFGTEVHTNSTYSYKIAHFPWKMVNEEARLFTLAYNKRYSTNYAPPKYNKEWFVDKCEQIGMDVHRAIKSIGTLGGGNHFIEIGKCQEGRFWVTIHSGSRQFGQKIASFWQKKAAENMMINKLGSMENAIRKIKEELPKQRWQKEIIKAKKARKYKVNGLEYLEGSDMFGYLTDMVFTQAYADENRKVMKELVLEVVIKKLNGEKIACSHNYIDFRDFIIRKGAISAYKGEGMIIPFNMEDGTLICEGKGNPEWNYSAPHGAGRLWSRSKAKKVAEEKGLVEAARKRMKQGGIYASSLPADELCSAYKDCAVIEEAIKPTVRIIRRIKPIIAIKEHK